MNSVKLFVGKLGALLLLVASSLLLYAQDSELYNQLRSFPEVVSIQKIDNNPFFKETYEIMVEQYLDQKNPAAGKFKQRVFLSDYNKYSPVVFVAEGYTADYAGKSTYINELSKILEANQIVVEHRYFGKSIPENVNWDYLTMENACGDLHRIMKIFKRLYNTQNKWIATGISKGGTNTMAYKAFYPDDVDIWVPYVGPINFSVEEKSHGKFLKSVGPDKCRDKIFTFQKEILMKRDSIQPLLDSLIDARKYSFRITNDEVLDFCVLEFSFAFWQWGTNCQTIPADSLPLRDKFNYLVKICNPDYFSLSDIAPIQAFFVQAAKEMGYYGYDTKALKPYLKIKDAKGYLPKIFLAENTAFKFSTKTSSFIEKTINSDGDHVLMIYGGYDPWTASSFRLKRGSKAVKMIIPKASHRVRIENMPLADRANVYMLLETWMNED